ncbi:hypothetical protein Poli38472_011616 [Pythium oligandrum]|uniref:Uncharacterized protein n=1 Tax=Pythium oligandrum TaxID=41045 RepID=A0A8K1CL62_PYTOL|nr:hypothetical protein Poli38472_011616 [Pythium oligandrum]|eukprot:TMW64736.1 hypothetical protein Poli38472_011616 [Pythium oligandrum]
MASTTAADVSFPHKPSLENATPSAASTCLLDYSTVVVSATNVAWAWEHVRLLKHDERVFSAGVLIDKMHAFFAEHKATDDTLERVKSEMQRDAKWIEQIQSRRTAGIAALHEFNSEEEADWIFGQSYFGVSTHWKPGADGTVWIKLDGEVEGVDLFNTIAVMREIDLFSSWVPLCNKSTLLHQDGPVDLLVYISMAFPLLSRDAVLHVLGINACYESRSIVLLGNSVDEAQVPAGVTVPKLTSWGSNRLDIRAFRALIAPITRTKARTCVVCNVDPKCPVPQSLINFAIKKVAGLLLYLLRREAEKIEKAQKDEAEGGPLAATTSDHVRRLQADPYKFYEWLRPLVEQWFGDLQSDRLPPPLKFARMTSPAPSSTPQERCGSVYAPVRLTALTDGVSWPINRCCYEELQPTDLAIIEQLFLTRDDTPVLMQWVIRHKPPRTFQMRLLVLSSFRLWLFKRKKQAFKNSLLVSEVYQLLHLHEINVLTTEAKPTSLQLRYRDAQHDLHELPLDPGAHCESVVRLLQRLVFAVRLGYPRQVLPVVRIPPTHAQWLEQFDKQGEKCGEALTTAYRCFCDDLEIPYRPSVTTRLQECLALACVDFQYCLVHTATTSSSMAPSSSSSPSLRSVRTSMLSGMRWLRGHPRRVLRPRSTAAIQWKELQALARTIVNSEAVEDVVVYDLALGDLSMLTLFEALLTPSCAIQGFSLTNVKLSLRALRALQNVVLQSTIQRLDEQGASGPASPNTRRQAMRLRRLDLSFNRFSPFMAYALSTTLELMPNGLELLQLEECRLGMAASARLLSAMKASSGFSSCLRELNLAGNTLSCDGSKALSQWITGAFALQSLDLSHTQLDTNVFLASFKQNTILHESTLTSLDLSYNRMQLPASTALGEILGRTQSLNTLFLRGMQAKYPRPQQVLASIQTIASRLRQRSSHKQGGLVIQAYRGRQRTLIPTTGLKTQHIQQILGPMFQNSTRAAPCLVDLSENDLRGAKAAAIAQLIDSVPSAMRASLRLDHTNLSDKAAVLLLHSLRGCRSLDSLSLEGNGFMHRQTVQSYKRFQDANGALLAVPSTLERAAGDALSLLLGGKTRDGSEEPPEPSFGALYRHKPKHLLLKELSLKADSSKIVFGPYVVSCAVEALVFNTTLQVLDVSGNECGDALATALGKILPENQSLQVLFWDGNFTTVDGFFAFYHGLLRNQTLSVVQLPIRDTRRILEEQKDPPRDKLFSVLGRIFKVTERNQTLAQAKARAASKPPHAKKTKRTSHSARKGTNQTEHTVPVIGDEQKKGNASPEEAEGSKEGGKRETVEPQDVDAVVDDSTWKAALYTNAATSRYPTTMQNWSSSRSISRDDAMRMSWDQLAAFSAMLT